MSTREIEGGLSLEIIRRQFAVSFSTQRAFILGRGFGMGFLEFDEILLSRLAVASPARPIFTRQLSAHMLAKFHSGRAEPIFVRDQVLQDISYLNRNKLPAVGLRIHNMSPERTEGRYFIGGVDNWLFPEQARVMNLLAAGFSLGEIAERVEKKVSALKKDLGRIYSWLGVSDGLGAVLFLAQHGQVELAHLNRDS